jgi:hypothetical protein
MLWMCGGMLYSETAEACRNSPVSEGGSAPSLLSPRPQNADRLNTPKV